MVAFLEHKIGFFFVSCTANAIKAEKCSFSFKTELIFTTLLFHSSELWVEQPQEQHYPPYRVSVVSLSTCRDVRKKMLDVMCYFFSMQSTPVPDMNSLPVPLTETEAKQIKITTQKWVMPCIAVLLPAYINEIRSDKRVTKCQFGQSEFYWYQQKVLPRSFNVT